MAQKPVGKKPAQAKEPLANIENGTASASDRYEKLTQLEHIIKRPDTYVGSIEHSEQKMWVFNPETSSMEFRMISFVPGLYKIFDEILVNAADNKQNDPNMDEIRITMDKESGEISVWNNGSGIPIEMHTKHNIYIPELLFGNLLSSSNYNDAQQKVTGGRNGFGAKLCNIFSTEFTVETADSRVGKKYKQSWSKNMTKMGKAKIVDYKGTDFTKVTFKPDFPRFKMEGMDADFESLVLRRVYDLAGTCKCAVKLNGTRVPVRNFKKYMEMYTNAIKKERGEEAANDKSEIITDSPDPRWEVGFAVSDGSFQQVSFVNSIATTSGGTHVNYIADQICDRLAETLKKKNKNGASLKASQIRNHIFIFINCLIVNPAFNSQTKEQLTTKPSQFGSKCILSDEFLKKIQKTQVMENIMHFAAQKADQIMKKSDGNRRARINNPKLVDANKAGTKDGHRCTLILTEGDSAKGLAMAGRAVVGPDLFGVFPLRGKLLNVRDASVDQVSKNAEIQNIKTFLGLQHKKTYTETKGLRYGHLMIMTDQDHDGSHIKGLLINYFEVAFPSLLKIPHFLLEFLTPIVKVWRGDPKSPTEVHSFYTMPEYETWQEAHSKDRRWENKYYKGLGTSTSEEGEEYFRDLDRHLKAFHVMQDQESQLIELAFSKKKTDERKEWLRQFKPGTYLDNNASESITYTDFVNKELILFSMADNMRSIPSVVDGMKPGQRKVIYTCLKKNLRKDMKVFELTGAIASLTAYHHGDTSLQQTIVGLAQDFVGSNNLTLLEPSGNFGSRAQGGDDAASARYIHTRLTPFARKIFPAIDDPLLTYNVDDGEIIEPEVYVPVVPMILINGAEGIGTGWSTNIPNYNPEDIVNNLRRLIRHEPVERMMPWYRGFTGEVVDSGGDRYKFCGRWGMTGDFDLEVTELPIRVWTQDFKNRLEEIIKGDKATPFIKDYQDYNGSGNVHFVIQLDEKHAGKVIEQGLEEVLKLTKTVATSNLVAFDSEGRINKYSSVEDILKEFYHIRLKYYEKRKQYQLDEMQKSLDKLTNQARFIQMIIEGQLVISRKSKKQLIKELKDKNFTPFPPQKKANSVEKGEKLINANGEEYTRGNEDEDEVQVPGVPDAAFEYLYSMSFDSLTEERVEKLRRQVGQKEMEITELIKRSKEDIWLGELDIFMDEWRDYLAREHDRLTMRRSRGRRVSTKLHTAGGAPAKTKKRKPAHNDDDDDFLLTKPKKKPPAKAKATAATAATASTKTSTKEAVDAAAAPPPPARASLMTSWLSKPTPKQISIESDDDDDDDDLMAKTMTKKASSKPAPAPAPARASASRPSRTTAKKAKYTISDDDDEEDDDNDDDDDDDSGGGSEEDDDDSVFEI